MEASFEVRKAHLAAAEASPERDTIPDPQAVPEQRNTPTTDALSALREQLKTAIELGAGPAEIKAIEKNIRGLEEMRALRARRTTGETAAIPAEKTPSTPELLRSHEQFIARWQAINDLLEIVSEAEKVQKKLTELKAAGSEQGPLGEKFLAAREEIDQIEHQDKPRLITAFENATKKAEVNFGDARTLSERRAILSKEDRSLLGQIGKLEAKLTVARASFPPLAKLVREKIAKQHLVQATDQEIDAAIEIPTINN